MNDADIAFRHALHTFRREQTIKIYSRTHLEGLGYGAIMGDRLLQRIVDCARANKIRSLEQLYRETKWNRAFKLGDAVIQLVNQ